MAEPKVKVQVTADASGLQAGLGQAAEHVKLFGEKVESAMSGSSGALSAFSSAMSGGIAGLAVGLVTAAGAGATALFSLGKRGLDTADQLNKMSEKTALSVEFLSALQVAATDADVELAQVGKGFKGFSVKLLELREGNKDAETSFRKMGLSLKDFQQLGDEDAFKEVLNQLGKMEGGARQTAAAVGMFGKAGLDMIAILKATGGDIDAWTAKMQEAGLIYDGAAAKRASDYNDTMKRLTKTMEALAFQVIEPMVPSLKGVADEMGRASANAKQLIPTIQTITAIGQHGGPGAFLAALWNHDAVQQTIADQQATQAIMDESRRAFDAKTQNLAEKAQAEEDKRAKAKEAANKAAEEARKKRLDREFAFILENLKKEEAEEKKSAEVKVKVAMEEAKDKRDVLVMGLEDQKKALEESRAAGNITELEYLNQLEKIELAKIQLYKAGVEERSRISINDPLEMAKLRGEMAKLQEQERLLQADFDRKKTTAASQQGGMAGWLAGLKESLKAAANEFETYKAVAMNVIGGIQNAFASGIQGMLSGQMSLAQGMKEIWKGIVQTVVGAIAQLVAQWIVMGVVKDALRATDVAAAKVTAAASLEAATAEIYAAHAWIPFAGVGIATGMVAAMDASFAAQMGTIAGITAMAVGGLIDKPTLSLMGEAGPEVVAPERDFKDWAAGLIGMGAGLSSSIGTQQHGIVGAQALGNGYARSAAAQRNASGPSQPIQISLAGATIYDTSARGMEALSELLWKAMEHSGNIRSYSIERGRAFGAGL